jgi:diguanylate cyclase (GGDEF)-like protein
MRVRWPFTAWHFSKRLRAWIAGAPAEPLPSDVYAVLVNDCYSVLLSFGIGAIGGVLVGSMAAWRTGSVLLLILTVLAAAVAVGRVLLTISYRKAQPVADAATLKMWERRYAIGALAYGACLGGFCFVTLALTNDAATHLIVCASALGFAAGTTARNSSRPRIAVAQVSLIVLPAAAACALRFDPPYLFLSALAILYNATTVEIANYLGGSRLRLLLATRELAQQNLRFDAALANMSHGLCMLDAELRLLVWNKRSCEILRIAPEALSPGIPLRSVVELSSGSSHSSRMAAELTAEFEARIASGDLAPWKRHLGGGRIIAIAHRPMPDGGAVVIIDDITEREQAEARVRFLATHDNLTGLPNRILFMEQVSEAVLDGRRQGRKFAIVFVDVDRFKIINDTLGHSAGDTLLIEIANRLKRCVEPHDIVARLSGDEFIILLRDASDPAQISKIARRMLSAILKPIVVRGQECRVTASLGISRYPSDAEDADTLIKNADAAMYAAKDEGHNGFRFHTAGLETQSIDRLMLENGLRQAIERNELLLHYQPKRSLHSGDITGVEALVRWQHPEFGLLLPARFIPLAEETDLIVAIGKWVLEAACAQNAAWQRAGLAPIQVAINLAARQFADPGLLEDVRQALRKSGMAPELLELEITETMAMQSVGRTVELLNAIKGLGVKIAIDDFGTGYSSMSLVKQLPIDVLKIDRSFIHEIASDSDDKAIAEAIIAFGRALDLTVVAEGVETAEQEALLRAHRCDAIQGFLVSKPMLPDEFVAFFATQALAKLKMVAAGVGAEAVRKRPNLRAGLSS